MQFLEKHINGVLYRHLEKHEDPRGWLVEVFRKDELDYFDPAMCYISLTLPGVTRGPHEHREQTDYFVFAGPGKFEIHLWDHRPSSATYSNQQSIIGGEEHPICVIVPPGVVHGYKNISDMPGLVVNCPNRLFAGSKRNEPIDEIRHEDNPDSPFQVEMRDRE